MLNPNISPEQKMVYFSKYNKLKESTEKASTNLFKVPQFLSSSIFPFYSEIEKETESTKEKGTEPVVENPKETKQVEIKQEEVSTKDDPKPSTKEKQMTTSKVIYYKHNGPKGIHADKPEPNTMLGKILRRLTQIPVQHNIYDELDQLEFSNEDKYYLKKLAFLESNFDQNQTLGSYKGLYQMGISALKDVGMDMENYLAATANQHLQALAYKNLNLEKLRRFVGKTINGITMNPNNLAAAQHLLGQSNVRKFIVSEGRHIAVDGNNTPITAYLMQFA